MDQVFTINTYYWMAGLDKKESAYFSKLYQKHIGLVIFFCKKQFRLDQATAEDVAQNAFMKAHEHLDQIETMDNFKAWILKIASNEAKMYLRKQGAEERKVNACKEQSEVLEQNLHDSTQRKREVELVSEFLKELPAGEDTDILKAFYIKEKSCKEIAGELGVKTSTITTKLSRLRGKIRLKLVDKILKFREKQLQ